MNVTVESLAPMMMTKLRAGVSWTGEMLHLNYVGDNFSPFVNIRKLEKHISHVAKLHETLEGRIIARHNEL